MERDELVSHRILQLLDERGWTVRQLAVRAGVKDSTLKNLINNAKVPSLATINKICAAFEIGYEEFFSGATGPQFTQVGK